MPGREVPVGLEELYECLAAAEQWTAPGGPIALRLVDSLWYGGHEEFAAQALALRKALEDGCSGHEAVRVNAGLSILMAERVIARVHHVAVSVVQRAVREEAAVAKKRHLFPWHLLDG